MEPEASTSGDNDPSYFDTTPSSSFIAIKNPSFPTPIPHGMWSGIGSREPSVALTTWTAKTAVTGRISQQALDHGTWRPYDDASWPESLLLDSSNFHVPRSESNSPSNRISVADIVRYRIPHRVDLVQSNNLTSLLTCGIADYTFISSIGGSSSSDADASRDPAASDPKTSSHVSLGKGKFSEVLLAEKDGASYAVKHTPLWPHHPLIAARLLREPTILARLRPHPNLVKVYETIRTPGNFYLVEENLARWVTLEKYIVSQPSHALSDDLTFHFLNQLASVVYSLHEPLHVAHRDIKPENILVDPETLCIKLLDFGLATHYSSSQARLTTCCGSPAYHSPELWLSLRSPTGAVRYWGPEIDIWCIGLSILRCVGRRQFPLGPSHTSLADIHKKATAALAPLSPRLRSVLSGLLDPNGPSRMHFFTSYVKDMHLDHHQVSDHQDAPDSAQATPTRETADHTFSVDASTPGLTPTDSPPDGLSAANTSTSDPSMADTLAADVPTHNSSSPDPSPTSDAPTAKPISSQDPSDSSLPPVENMLDTQLIEARLDREIEELERRNHHPSRRRKPFKTTNFVADQPRHGLFLPIRREGLAASDLTIMHSRDDDCDQSGPPTPATLCHTEVGVSRLFNKPPPQQPASPTSPYLPPQPQIVLGNPFEHPFSRVSSFLKYSLRCAGIIYNVLHPGLHKPRNSSMYRGYDTDRWGPDDMGVIHGFLECVMPLPASATRAGSALRNVLAAGTKSSADSAVSKKKVNALVFYMALEYHPGAKRLSKQGKSPNPASRPASLSTSRTRGPTASLKAGRIHIGISDDRAVDTVRSAIEAAEATLLPRGEDEDSRGRQSGPRPSSSDSTSTTSRAPSMHPAHAT